MATELHFSDVSPRCSECGCPADDGYIIKGSGMREPDTDYEDSDVICAACDEEGERDMAADAAYDMREGY